MKAQRGHELRGRDEVKAVLEGAIAGLGDSRGSLVLLSGPPGIGKTAIMQHATRVARAAGVRLITGRALEHEQGRPFGAFPASRHDRCPVLGTSVGTLSGGLNGREWQIDRFLGLIRAAGPCLVAVDDLQWADETTLLALAATANRLDHVAVALVGCFRTAPRPPSLPVLLEAAPSGRHIHLAPLDPGSVAAIIEDRLGSVSPDLRVVLERAGGNPFYLNDLISAFVAEERLVGSRDRWQLVDGTIPERLFEAVQRHLHRLSPPTRVILEFASGFGGPFGAGQLGRASGANTLELGLAVHEGIAHGFLKPIQRKLDFCHDILREGVYRSMTSAVAAQVHRDITDLLIESDAPATQVAQQVLAGPETRPDAADLLLAGAEQALACSPHLARSFAEQALAVMPPTGPARSRALATLGCALLWSDDPGGALTLADRELAERPPPEARLQLVALRAEALFAGGRLGEAGAIFEKLAAVGRPGLHRAEAGVCRLLIGDMAMSGSMLATARREARADNDARGESEALGGLAWHEALTGDPDAGAELARAATRVAAEDPSEGHRATPWLFLGQCLHWANDSEGAMDAFEQGRAETARLGIRWHECLHDTAIAVEHLRSGSWDDAIVVAESALSRSRGDAGFMSDMWAHAALIEIWRRRGDRDRARSHLSAAEQLMASGAVQGTDVILWQRSLLKHDDGDIDGAFQLLWSVWKHLDATGVLLRCRELAADVVHLAIRAGHNDCADHVIERCTSAAERVGRVEYRATALRCRGVLERDADAFRQALRLIRGLGRPVDAAMYFEDGAFVLIESGQAGRARPWLREAVKRYQAVRAAADLGRVARRAEPFGFAVPPVDEVRPVAGWESLTRAERRVTELVIRGLSNPEIAQELGVSRRTVESHLYRVFPKLRVTSRLELAVTCQPVPRRESGPGAPTGASLAWSHSEWSTSPQGMKVAGEVLREVTQDLPTELP